jgi:hypothetical protein
LSDPTAPAIVKPVLRRRDFNSSGVPGTCIELANSSLFRRSCAFLLQCCTLPWARAAWRAAFAASRAFCFAVWRPVLGPFFWPTGPGLAPHHDLTIRAAAVAPCNSTITLIIGPSYTSADQSKLPERKGSVSWKQLENSSKTGQRACDDRKSGLCTGAGAGAGRGGGSVFL